MNKYKGPTAKQIEPILDDFLAVDSPHYEELRRRCAQRIFELCIVMSDAHIAPSDNRISGGQSMDEAATENFGLTVDDLDKDGGEPTPLIELADRVQALTCACRVTDALIWCALEPTYGHRTSHPDKAPEFTGSLDAAMTLVSPNHRWLMNGPDVDGAGDDIKPCASVLPYGESLTHPQDSHEAATPVLAFLSAILRARAASENSHGR